MEVDALHQVVQTLGRSHPEVIVDDRVVRVIGTRQVEVEIQPTASDNLSKGLKAGNHITSFPSGDHRLRFGDSRS